MATLWITELATIATVDTPIAQLPPIAAQTVTFTTSTQSAALNEATRYVRIISDANCNISVGINPTATASNMRMTADIPEYFGVTPGHKIAVVAG